jgi:putative membrane protein
MDTPSTRTFKDYLKLVLSGLFIGAADVVPGVSGGTMAFILGIYDELIDAIRSAVPFLKNLLMLRFREAFTVFPWRFLLAVGLGIGLAILSLANFLHWALDEHPSYIYALFFGLILASIDAVRRRVKSWNVLNLSMVALAAIGSYLLIGLSPANTPESLWFIFLSGAVAICAMILPGISGAFILVLLGKYRYILGALLSLDVPTVLTFMLGAAVGIIAFSNILRWLLDHYHDLTVAILLGFMIGALRKVWPWKLYEPINETFIRETNILPAGLSPDVWASIGLMVVGIALVFAVETYAIRHVSKTH